MIDEVVWKNGEKIVKEYMINNGYDVVYTNYKCIGVEVDIVAILGVRSQVKKLKSNYYEEIKQLNQKQMLIKSGRNNAFDNKFICDKIDLQTTSKNNYLKKEIEKIKAQKKSLKISYKSQRKQIEKILVVTEVKARSSDKFGIGAESISDYKIKNIKKAGYFLLNSNEFKGLQIRFDVASVDEEKITYIEDAF